MARLSLVAAALLTVCSISVSAQIQPPEEDCGPLSNAFGPFDYRVADGNTRSMVETHHFTPEVERLERGVSSSLGGDIAYTLRAFPNHPRALAAMVRLGVTLKVKKPVGSPYSIDCWLERASRFQPDDTSVLTITGYYQSKNGDRTGAIRTYRKAIEMGRDDGNIHYNLGLLLLEEKDFTGALDAAKKARARGFSLDGLEKKLKAQGRWQ